MGNGGLRQWMLVYLLKWMAKSKVKNLEVKKDVRNQEVKHKTDRKIVARLRAKTQE